jgi:hypothetical protein
MVPKLLLAAVAVLAVVTILVHAEQIKTLQETLRKQAMEETIRAIVVDRDKLCTTENGQNGIWAWDHDEDWVCR